MAEILAGVVLLPLIVFAFLAFWYFGAFDSSLRSEQVRKKIDALFETQYKRRTPPGVWVHDVVFGNNDKYVFRPPRIEAAYDNKGKFLGFELHALVLSWNPGGKLLRVRTYTRREADVRLDPERDKSFAVVAPMDRYGKIPSVDSIKIVTSSDDPLWERLFCAGDTVVIRANKKSVFMSSPVVPENVRLTHRLCGT